MTTSIIKTNRLTLAYPLVHEGMDVSHYLKWLCNESVTKYSEQRHLTHTDQSQYEFISSFVGTEDFFWEIRRDATPIGSITAYRDIPNRCANLGIMIGDTRVWGQGYGPEAWEGVCNYLFEQGTRKIEAGCMSCNRPMLRILDKTGFKLEAIVHNHFLLNGNPEHKVMYAKYREAKIIEIKPRAQANLA